MYCKKCGNKVSVREKFCPHCGTPLFETEQTSTYNNVEQTPNIEQPKFEPKSNVNKTETSTVGVLAVVFSALGSFVGLVLGLVGLFTYKEAKNKRLCKVSIIIMCVWFVLNIVACFAFIDEYYDYIPPEFYY